MNHSDWIERIKGQLDSLDQQMDELGKKVENAREGSRAELQNLKNVVAGKRKALKADLEKLQAATSENASTLSKNAETTWKTFQQSVRYFKATLNQRLGK